MEEYEFKAKDIVTINAEVTGITPSKNLVVRLNSGVRFLIKPSEVVAVHPYKEPVTEDLRRGN